MWCSPANSFKSADAVRLGVNLLFFKTCDRALSKRRRGKTTHLAFPCPRHVRNLKGVVVYLPNGTAFSALRPYSPGGGLNGFPSPPGRPVAAPTASPHCLQLGLPGYLIPFAPPAFAPHRRACSGAPPSPLMVLPGSEDFTPTPGIPGASPTPKPGSIPRSPRVKPVDLTRDTPGRLRAL